jgi:uncharacterized protein (TIGR03437 family)
MKTKNIFLALILGACAFRSYAQPVLGSSGNGLLNGTYYMRQVFYVVNSGAISQNLNVQGAISFSGRGSYTFNGSVQDSASTPTMSALTTTGTYELSASGEGYISALDTSFSDDRIIGMVSNGIFIGSTTESGEGYNDLFIAAPIGSSQATSATLSGSYTVAYFDPTFPGDALFTMSADGQGNIGTVSVTSYTGNSTTPATQSLSGVTYAFTNGAATLKFGGKRSSSIMLAGTELLYISPDGSFIFGGSETGYDMFVGIRAATSPPSNYDGLYYQAGLDLDESASSGISPLDSYYGSFQALSGQIIGHQRFTTASSLRYQSLTSLSIYGGTSDFTYHDSYTLNSDGSSDDTGFSQHYLSSTDGTIRIGYGIGPFLSLAVALQAPSLTGSGVYLSPVGVVNAASSAPFTAQVSPGEFLTLYGSALASTTASASVPFPSILEGVQVMINNVAAPIYYVSPTQISVVVPYLTPTDSTTPIYVANNGSNSNVVYAFTGSTSVGTFTNNPVGGLGYAAALHPDYSVISESSPAQIGETVAVYLTGLGAVIPGVADGRAAPSNPPSITSATPLVFLLDGSGNYLQAQVTFSGLAPGYAGLYQIDFVIPSGLTSGVASLEIIGPDSDAFQSLLPITPATVQVTPTAAANAPFASRHRLQK